MEELETQFHLRLPKDVHGKIKQRAKMNVWRTNTPSGSKGWWSETLTAMYRKDEKPCYSK